ncbi:unnamed protein product, partial [Amoebophrya sp. A120]
ELSPAQELADAGDIPDAEQVITPANRQNEQSSDLYALYPRLQFFRDMFEFERPSLPQSEPWGWRLRGEEWERLVNGAPFELLMGHQLRGAAPDRGALVAALRHNGAHGGEGLLPSGQTREHDLLDTRLKKLGELSQLLVAVAALRSGARAFGLHSRIVGENARSFEREGENVLLLYRMQDPEEVRVEEDDTAPEAGDLVPRSFLTTLLEEMRDHRRMAHNRGTAIQLTSSAWSQRKRRTLEAHSQNGQNFSEAPASEARRLPEALRALLRLVR